MPMASHAPPDSNVHIDDLDLTGLAPHSAKHSFHESALGDNGAPSTHQPSDHPSHPQSKEPSHAGLALDAQQPPPIPRPDHNPNVIDGDVYLETATTADRIQDNLWLAVSLALATVFWLIALVSQAIVTGSQGNAFVRTAWLALVIQLLLILLTSTLLLTTHLPPYHIQISTLAAMVVVLGSLAVDANIYTPSTSAQKAMAAAWILTCLVDILFVLYFSSPPQHPLVALLHGGYSAQDAQTEMAYRKSNFFAGGQSNRNTVTGYLAAPPNRLSRAGSGNIELGPVGGNGNRLSMARSQSGRPLSGIPETAASGARTSGSGADDAQATLQRPQLQQGQGEGSRKSGRFSLYRREKEREREREQQEAASQGQGGSVSGVQGQESMDGRPASQKPVVCRAEALFAYHAASEDPTELSFRKGEVLDIVDRSGKWWEGRRDDGSQGIVPSNYLRVLDA